MTEPNRKRKQHQVADDGPTSAPFVAPTHENGDTVYVHNHPHANNVSIQGYASAIGNRVPQNVYQHLAARRQWVTQHPQVQGGTIIVTNANDTNNLQGDPNYANGQLAGVHAQILHGGPGGVIPPQVGSFRALLAVPT